MLRPAPTFWYVGHENLDVEPPISLWIARDGGAGNKRRCVHGSPLNRGDFAHSYGVSTSLAEACHAVKLTATIGGGEDQRIGGRCEALARTEKQATMTQPIFSVRKEYLEAKVRFVAALLAADGVGSLQE